ncbi:hypothetical protein HC762_01590 [bacterium]|nr:hypothetical protein [bacterium]
MVGDWKLVDVVGFGEDSGDLPSRFVLGSGSGSERLGSCVGAWAEAEDSEVEEEE